MGKDTEKPHHTHQGHGKAPRYRGSVVSSMSIVMQYKT